MLTGLRERGLTFSPKLATSDGALCFLSALSKVYPACRHQRCWVHKTANIVNKLLKCMQPKVKEALYDIWMAESRDKAKGAFERTITQFGAMYPQAIGYLEKHREELLAFYNFRGSTGFTFGQLTQLNPHFRQYV